MGIVRFPPENGRSGAHWGCNAERGGSAGELVSREERNVNDRLDVTLEDPELLDEVELTTDLMIAATETSGRLSSDRVDELLRIPRQQDRRAS